MEISKQFIEETTTFMKKIGVASFEVSPEGTLKVSFDPRSFDAPEQITTDVIRQKLSELVVDGEKQRVQEEEDFLYSSV